MWLSGKYTHAIYLPESMVFRLNTFLRGIFFIVTSFCQMNVLNCFWAIFSTRAYGKDVARTLLYMDKEWLLKKIIVLDRYCA